MPCTHAVLLRRVASGRDRGLIQDPGVDRLNARNAVLGGTHLTR